ncbi:MAG: serine hydroxymethyltransferase, partial [Eubacteriales bacterium]|nr:serine hydroxymethyltransferase [Eubacteriales bacterium]
AAQTSGIRVGTPAVTTRGFVEEDMKQVARLIYMTASDFETKADQIRSEVETLCAKYPIYE